ncbi:MAG: gamma carbonic anhydrase family protein [Deltaproteobacteria bacterium]|nr:gamma carbonic anhydrase family protein [Deltaproteobacteria bacterium]MCL5878341.1 gamma carbonic anhydrase family protein [Deltaproteobacteria bacterium]
MKLTYNGKVPEIHESAYVAGNAIVLGDVVIGAGSSVWFNAVVRGDENYIRIGSRTNVQDNCVLHVTHKTHPLFLGDDITIGHGAVVHGCRIKNVCLIGIGAIILDGAVVGEESIVAAGSVVKEGMIVPPRTLVAGVPAVVKRELTREDIDYIMSLTNNYIEITKVYSGQPGQ